MTDCAGGAVKVRRTRPIAPAQQLLFFWLDQVGDPIEEPHNQPLLEEAGNPREAETSF